MEATIQDLFRLPDIGVTQKSNGNLVSNTKIGIEVEVEGVSEPPHIPGWRAIQDGSLRNNGIEYVFNAPIGGKAAETRINKLHEGLSDIDKDFSIRTSVHVHMDARDMTWKQVCDLVTLYAITEPYLFAVCGQEREESIYALSLYRGQQQVDNLSRIIRLGPEALNERLWTKYSAVNLLSLRSLGSLEFRGHEGTCDKDVLINWVNHLLSLKKFVMNPENSVASLPVLLSAQGLTPFLRKIFGDSLIRKNLRRVAQVADKIYHGVWVAEDIIHDSAIRNFQHELLEKYRGTTQMEKIKDKLCAV